jgi:hypothetical protein
MVLGIPTLAVVNPQLGGSAPGIGFAIPSDIATDLATQIMINEHVINSRRAALGVSISTVTDEAGKPVGGRHPRCGAGQPSGQSSSPGCSDRRRGGHRIDAGHHRPRTDHRGRHSPDRPRGSGDHYRGAAEKTYPWRGIFGPRPGLSESSQAS